MKKLILLFIPVFIFTQATTDKVNVKIKNGYAYANNEIYFKWIKDKSVKFTYHLITLSNDTIGYLKRNNYNDPVHINKSNPNGNVMYHELVDHRTGEIYFEYLFAKKRIIKMLYTDKVINADSSVNRTNLMNLAKKQGKEVSRRRLELGR